jgi:uncharacterized cupredoxin-like copper-binding protein
MIKKILSISLFSLSFAFSQIIAPKATVQISEYDFGNVEQGKVVNYNFTLTNTGGDVLKIMDVRASCGCTAAKPEKSELNPGESTAIKVAFNSTGRLGQQQKYVYVVTNDPSNKEIRLKISGNVMTPGTSLTSEKSPKIYFPETQFDFGKVKEGDVVSHTFKFINNGKADLNINDIKTSCGCTAALVSSKKIEPGKEGTIKVDLNTKSREGKMSRTITILSNDPEEPNKVITIFADVNKASN